ncbi:MAG: TetR/AcrR family transcriptional regulator [Desulfuromonadales bacterium]
MTLLTKSHVKLPQRGRPRSEESRQSILLGTAAILAERGYEGLSIEAVATKAEVGKQTIYRWWHSKADLVIDALSELAAQQVDIPDTGSVTGDLRELLKNAFFVLTATPSGNAVIGLLVATQRDTRISKVFRERFVEKRRGAVREIFQRGIQREQIRANLDTDLIIDLIYGPMWYRLLVGHAPLDEVFADTLVEQIMVLLKE